MMNSPVVMTSQGPGARPPLQAATAARIDADAWEGERDQRGPDNGD